MIWFLMALAFFSNAIIRLLYTDLLSPNLYQVLMIRAEMILAFYLFYVSLIPRF